MWLLHITNVHNFNREEYPRDVMDAGVGASAVINKRRRIKDLPDGKIERTSNDSTSGGSARKIMRPAKK